MAVALTVLHVITLLGSFWNVKLRAMLQYKKLHVASNAEILHLLQQEKQVIVKVEPNEHRGEIEMCPIHKRLSVATGSSFYFDYQKRKYTFNTATNLFEKPAFPINESIQNYKKKVAGIANTLDVERLRQSYDRNVFEIPIPRFIDLFKEHALAPFFVFQVGCVGLWCLDEYWYYSILTLVMLFVFESTVVNSVCCQQSMGHCYALVFC